MSISLQSVRQRTHRAVLALAACSFALALPIAADAQRRGGPEGGGPSLVQSSPQSVGMSRERLRKIEAAFRKEVDEKRLPGAVMLVARHGRLVYAAAVGQRDPKASDAMRADTVFRIYSMTKPIASVGAMILVEDGILQLTDPVAKWLPAFKDMKVLTANGEEAARPMSVQDLLRHTAGLPYGELTANAAVRDRLGQAGLFKPNVIDFDIRDMTGQEMVERIAKVPLLFQPGSAWEYSLATDVLGRVIEAASGKRLGEFLSQRIFEPLGMEDTGFTLPADSRSRLAEPLEKEPVGGQPIRLIDVTMPPGNDSAGAGLVSTAGDYLRFAQMLANGGELDGTRILSRATIKWMVSDHLGDRIRPAATPGGGVLGARAGYGFGLGFAVRSADGMAAVPGSAGDFDWGGYPGNSFWVDPQEGIVGVLMVQSGGPIRGYHRNLFRQLVYQAIID